MGEVYRARDAKLGRDVAIKVLPAVFTADRDRLARFEREARVLASLNHPNIAAIYGLEQEGGVHALVLELVEGETLAERIAVKRLGVRDSLTIARQIADGLEAAHEKGVVHRDLKPANIKITPGGTVKVLDFGLAKSAAASGPNLSHSPTITISGTREGVLLGTAAYMSPEQARGQPVDKRADIWAFGCVLFEMLTSRMAFPGTTVSDHIAAILEREPDWSAVPAAPIAIRRVLGRCLEKDPKRRLHDIADARIEIDDALTGEATPRPSGWTRPRPLMQWIAWAAATVVVAALTGWVAIGRVARREPAGDRSVTRFVFQPPASAPISGMFALSADGTQLVYPGSDRGQRLYLRRLDQFEAAALPGTDGGYAPFFSPDGQWVGFVANGKLQKIKVGAAAPPVVLSDTGGFNNATWLDDTIVYDGVRRGIRRISAEGGEPTALTELTTTEFDHHRPQLLPGGQAVLFTVHHGVERFSVAVQSIASSERKILIESGFAARYVPSGHIVYATGNTIRAVAFDLRRLVLAGAPVTVVEHVYTVPNDGDGNFDISASGTLVFEPEHPVPRRTLMLVDRSGIETELPIAPRAFTSARLSPDGKRIAFAALEGEREDVWIYELATDNLNRATLEDINRVPLWTNDGRRLVYEKLRAGTHHLFWQPLDGSRPPASLLAGVNRLHPGAWTLDDRGLLYVESPPSDLSELAILRLDGASPSSSVLYKPAAGFADLPSLSPDRRWLAYTSNETGRAQVYVQAFPTPGSRHQVTVESGFAPVWSRNGRELFFLSRGAMFALPVNTNGTFSAGKAQRLFEGRYLTQRLDGGHPYDVAADGRFLMIKPSADELAPPRLNVVVNWAEELRRRLPSSR